MAWHAGWLRRYGWTVLLVVLGCRADDPAVGRVTYANHQCTGLDENECPDPGPCTEATCDPSGHFCMNTPIPSCCTADDECNDGPACTRGRCVDNRCVTESIAGCVPDGGASVDGAIADAAPPDGPRTDAGHADGRAPPGGPTDSGTEVDGSGRDADVAMTPRLADGRPDQPLDFQGGACSVAAPAKRHAGRGAGVLLLLLALLALCAARRRSTAAAVLALMLVATSQPVRADGFRLDRYAAPVAPDDLLWLERASVPSKEPRAFVRLTAAFADDPLAGTSPDGMVRSAVREQLGLFLSAGIAAFERVALALQAPLWWQEGDVPRATAAAPAQSLEPGGAGDPAVDLRVALLGPRSPWEVALAGTVRVPVGQSGRLAADDGPSGGVRAIVGYAFDARGSFAGAMAGVSLRPGHELASLRIGHELVWTLGGRLALDDRIGLTAELAGSTVLARAFDARHSPLEMMLGADYATPTQVRLSMGVGAGLTPGYGAPDARVVVGLGWRQSSR